MAKRKDYSVFNPPKLTPGASGGGDVVIDPATGNTLAAPEQYNVSGQYGLILNSQQRQPKTHNQLLPTSYKFVLARAPQLTFYCQSLSLPTISTDTITQESPFTDISNPAGKISFEDLTLNFVVDEKMANWLEIYHWMTSLVPVDRLDEHSESANTGVVYPKDRFSDLSVVVTTNQSNAQIVIDFKNAFPISLGEIEFTSVGSDIDPVSSNVTFSYDTYTVSTLPNY